MRELFYRPQEGSVGDPIPFYAKESFRLFYLHDDLDTDKKAGMPWYQISTDDFIHFTEHGVAIPPGTTTEQDFFVFTGCAIEARGQYHIFYTGHNGEFPKQNKPMQGVMHAVSDDLLTWKKIPEDTFYAPAGKYEMNDWRDPFVFWNEAAGEYWMLLAARLITGPSRRRGCIALCVSKDLKKWDVRDPFWSPGLYYTHEVPDLFQIGDWWYLVYSTFSERYVTHYRMSRSLKGPWIAPANDTFDGRAFYAAKTASDGKNRYVFGWNPRREGDKDTGVWQWGGSLVAHQVVQESDGSLSVRVPDTLDRLFSRQIPVTPKLPGLGTCTARNNHITIDAEEKFGCCSLGPIPSRCKIQAKIKFSENTRGCGLMLRTADDYESTYYVRLEPERQRIVFDGWLGLWVLPLTSDLERPAELKAGQWIDVKIITDATVCEIYVNDKVALSARMYNLPEGNWGVFTTEGTAEFKVDLFQQE